jgi:putative phage-type endonuclease
MRLNLRSASNREEWLANRAIGASSVAAILGSSPYQTRYDVWATLTGRYSQPESEAMTRGKTFEPAVVALYPHPVELPPPFSTYVGEEPWQTATPDGFVLGEMGQIEGLLECKTDGYHLYPPQVPEIRPDYVAQCRWQMFVCDAPWVDLAVLLPFYDFRVFRIERDLDAERDMYQQVRDFYLEHIVADVAPPVDDSDAALHMLSLVERKAVRPATVEEMRLAARYEITRKEADASFKEKKELANKLASLAGDNLSLEIAGLFGDARVTISKKGTPRVTGTLNFEAIFQEVEDEEPRVSDEGVQQRAAV